MTMAISQSAPDADDVRGLLRALDEDIARRYPGVTIHAVTSDEMQHPQFVLLVARVDGQSIGCGGVRQLEPTVGEVKRMFVREQSRGCGVARALLAALESEALGRGWTLLRVETGKGQPEAIALYRSSGYVEIPPFGEYVGNPASVCFEKPLR